jgi:hypothetical protein
MTLWSTVNVTLEPHLKDEIMRQRLNVFFCSKCDYHGSVDASLLYHDMDGHYCIQYVAKEDMKSPDFYSNLKKDGTLILDPISAKALAARGEDHFTRPHHVFSMKEVILYVAFRDLCAVWGKEP